MDKVIEKLQAGRSFYEDVSDVVVFSAQRVFGTNDVKAEQIGLNPTYIVYVNGEKMKAKIGLEETPQLKIFKYLVDDGVALPPYKGEDVLGRWKIVYMGWIEGFCYTSAIRSEKELQKIEPYRYEQLGALAGQIANYTFPTIKKDHYVAVTDVILNQYVFTEDKVYLVDIMKIWLELEPYRWVLHNILFNPKIGAAQKEAFVDGYLRMHVPNNLGPAIKTSYRLLKEVYERLA